MRDAELEQAIADDLKQRVARVKDAIVTESPDAPPMDPELRAKLGRAVELKVELAGFSSMSEAIKKNPNVVETVWPKVREYCALRIELAISQVVEVVAAEMGIPKTDVLGSVANRVAPHVVEVHPVDDQPHKDVTKMNLQLKEALVALQLKAGIEAMRAGDHVKAGSHIEMVERLK